MAGGGSAITLEVNLGEAFWGGGIGSVGEVNHFGSELGVGGGRGRGG